jgi:hypothetical protein
MFLTTKLLTTITILFFHLSPPTHVQIHPSAALAEPKLRQHHQVNNMFVVFSASSTNKTASS